jgi:hypothetical protein
VEYAFELALCAHLERTRPWVLGRQLGAAVSNPGSRVIDVCGVVPGPEFDDRTAITAGTIPPRAVESDVGPGRAVDPRNAFDCPAAVAERVVDRAIDIGFFEAVYRGGRRYVRATTRYPEDWVGRLVGIENKPDLGRPGDLRSQLRRDVSLSLFDTVILATESYVTGAHLNRIPEEVGVWRFVDGDVEVVREPARLPVAAPSIERRAEHRDRTDVAVVSPKAKARARRAVAERAYGKGWRPDAYPGCASMAPTADGRPHCAAFDRVVDPGSDCGPSCPAFEAADPPAVDADALRDARTPWVADPPGVRRRQSGLDRFT